MHLMKYVVVLFLMVMSSSADGEVFPVNANEKQAKFVADKQKTGEALCATDAPGRIYTKVRSKISCTGLCQENSDVCTGVNWKEPHTCEMFSGKPSNFLPKQGCSYYSIAVNFISIFDYNVSAASTQSILIPTFDNATTLMTIDGWMVIFQKIDTNTSFNRPWDDYVNGFGTYDYNFWMGLEKIHQLTSNGRYSLKLEVLLQNGNALSAEYASFQLSNQSYLYTISVSGFSVTDGDIMTGWWWYWDGFNGMKFSTHDKDNDNCYNNCGSRCGIGWWYNHCDWPREDFYIPLDMRSPVSKVRMSVKQAY